VTTTIESPLQTGVGKYCCFLDPEASFDDRSLGDVCPHCGRPYGFPILTPPEHIGEYKVVEALDRGFYAATYVVEKPPFGARAVLKVVPRKLYAHFNKDFATECRLHHDVAQGNLHIIDIATFYDADVRFADVEIPCHVAELRYVEGSRLDRILRGAESLEAHTLAQIAIDLLYILAEFSRRNMFHNDLQAANIVVEHLSPEERRFDAVDESVRTVAIDLGSVSDEARGADPNSHHLSDIRSIAGHLLGLVDRMLSDPERVSDLTFRVARALEDHAYLMTPDARHHKIPKFDEMAEGIRRAVERVTAPWQEQLTLRRFSHYQNAQQLDAWHIPMLLEDNDGEWLDEINGPEPQLLKGMRGCGKTMLLRALEFHARITPREDEDVEQALERVRKEGYIGLYFPSMRLMDKPGAPTQPVEKPYVRLYVAYALQALRAVHHLHDVARDEVAMGWHVHIAEAVQTYLKGVDHLADRANEFELENALVELQVALGRGGTEYELDALPSEAFPHLAEAIRRCSGMWSNFKVLFLLDDVSTRYLRERRIEDLISNLLFPSPVCSFKMTTEGQTFEALLRSSGRIQQAMLGRDYARFDLGEAVNRKLNEPGRGGQEFIERILVRRARHYRRHPDTSPSEVLGDAGMEDIARSIASVKETAPQRKSVYHGLTALTKVCVGDISDIINIYDDILSSVRPDRELPVPPAEQTRVYQEHCSGRLLDLTRLDAQNKTQWRRYATGFADASYELMMQSHLRPRGRGGRARTRHRLRQYNEVYVRITSGDDEHQFNRLRELVDSGVFVLEGGTDKPRSKTRDSDPAHQFKLAYRKIFGLSKFIGIADSDRFELSGERLERWLNEPENCKAILLENLTTDGEAEKPAQQVAPPTAPKRPRRRAGAQHELPRNPPPEPEPLFELETPQLRIPDAIELKAGAPQLEAVRSVVVGLGFEDRTLASAERLLQHVRAQDAVVVRYPQKGHADAIGQLAEAATGGPSTVVDYKEAFALEFPLPPGPCAVDVTGLAKPALFHAIRSALRRDREVYVVHTNAAVSWPREEELQAALDAAAANDDDALWARLRKVYSGEDGPYEPVPLMVTDSDETRRRVLSAASSPRSGRLLRLLDEVAYDQLEIFASAASTARGEVARRSARIAARSAPTDIAEVDVQEVRPMLERMGEQHSLWFTELGCNIELGLTGSKMHAVACAAAATTLRFSRCWYVRPAKFDTNRFTEGIGDTRYLRLTVEPWAS
jgi:hypothetical protein